MYHIFSENMNYIKINGTPNYNNISVDVTNLHLILIGLVESFVFFPVYCRWFVVPNVQLRMIPGVLVITHMQKILRPDDQNAGIQLLKGILR